MEEYIMEPPKKFIKDIRLFRFSSIYFNISLTFLFLTVLVAISSFILPVFYGLIMVVAVLLLILSLVLVIVSFGTILLAPNHPTKILYNFIMNAKMDKSIEIAQKFLNAIPYLCIAGLSCAIISIVFISICKTKNKVVKIVWASIFIVVLALVLALYYIMGGKLWQS